MNLSLLLRIFYFQYIKRKIIPEIPVIKIQSGDILQMKFIDLIDHPESGRFHEVFLIFDKNSLFEERCIWG